MMTFKMWSPQVSFKALISARTLSYCPILTQPMLITMSISSAPSFNASFVSNTFTAVVLYPCGNPITVQTGIFPSRYSAACFTKDGGMQTDAVPYFTASSQISLICSQVDGCFNSVWSTFFNISLYVIFFLILPFRDAFYFSSAFPVKPNGRSSFRRYSRISPSPFIRMILKVSGSPNSAIT
ncbi:putative uncharacterized protein [Clostridium sp. CAG:81]|nr:putative uncharacterized protein [Clostridium sp. CAG:81]